MNFPHIYIIQYTPKHTSDNIKIQALHLLQRRTKKRINSQVRLQIDGQNCAWKSWVGHNINAFFPFRSFSTGQNRRFFGPIRSCLYTVIKKIKQKACISATLSKKQNLFFTYITYFRSIQSLKTLIFQYKSLHCCHTLLKINKDY